MSQGEIEAESLKSINELVPVEGALDDNLEVRFERVKKLSDARQVVSNLLLEVNRKVLINDTQMRVSCGEIDTGVEHRGRSPF